ncbi:MAG: AMIN domain-containing protein, partial [Thermodesulfobacteriota bacterium]
MPVVCDNLAGMAGARRRAIGEAGCAPRAARASGRTTAAVAASVLALLTGCGAPSLRIPGLGGDARDTPAAMDAHGDPRASASGAPHAAAAQPTPAASPRPAQRIERIAIERSVPTTRVVLELDGWVEPEVSLLANHRLVLDLPGTTCETLPRVVESDDALVERVRTGQHAAPDVKSRVVIDLRRRADFAVRSHPRQVVVVLSAADGPVAAPPDATPAALVLLGAERGETGEAPAGDASSRPADADAPAPVPAATPAAPPVVATPEAEPVP